MITASARRCDTCMLRNSISAPVSATPNRPSQRQPSAPPDERIPVAGRPLTPGPTVTVPTSQTCGPPWRAAQAVFVTVAGAVTAGESAVTMLSVTVSPGLSDGIVRLTCCPLTVAGPRSDAALTTVIVAGTLSVTTTLLIRPVLPLRIVTFHVTGPPGWAFGSDGSLLTCGSVAFGSSVAGSTVGVGVPVPSGVSVSSDVTVTGCATPIAVTVTRKR